MREQEGAAASTVHRRLAALSSLFKHLVRHGGATPNPVVDVQRPSINPEEGSTAAFSKTQARRLLDALPVDTVRKHLRTSVRVLRQSASSTSMNRNLKSLPLTRALSSGLGMYISS